MNFGRVHFAQIATIACNRSKWRDGPTAEIHGSTEEDDPSRAERSIDRPFVMADQIVQSRLVIRMVPTSLTRPHQQFGIS